ncbi:MAG: bifunctional protein-serine/threonine kinase/phosphatase [Proteobacteria bacterium]|nr:bifunctional protein-serine/threonine kinase/phosphatase [Pseudomonadota bacterium]
MPGELRISIGQHSDKGRKEANQDFHGAIVPNEPKLSMKGAAVALADGISSSNVSHIASESAVASFLSDYYCTSETWSVKTSVHRVLAATNSWLNSQTRHSPYHYDKDKGYVCTFSAIVIKSTTAHIFSIGDTRVYRVSGQTLEQLTEDHRVVVSSEQSYLSRALGVDQQVEIDYLALPIVSGDVFVLATDGVYEHVAPQQVVRTIGENSQDLDRAAASLVKAAYDNGSTDNLTVQIVRVDDVPNGEATEILGHSSDLPLPPLLEARAIFDGYRIVREIHASSRSHIYLAVDIDSNTPVALKIPSIDLRGDPDYLKRFMMEEWVARRIASPYVLKPHALTRKRNFLYTVAEFVEGQTLHQWILDNPKPSLETVRRIVEQIALGLGAFHRLEMLHQDLRPHNIMIDATGTAKIIDFGSTRIAGVAEATPADDGNPVLGTLQYTAPECLLGDGGSPRSDLFSLGVIAYQMLTGKLPYGSDSAKARTRAQFQKLRYRPASPINAEVPVWVDGAIKRAVYPNPGQRYEALSEFVFDLRHPSADYLDPAPVPLMERNPLLFWQVSCGLLAVAVMLLLARLYGAL